MKKIKEFQDALRKKNIDVALFVSTTIKDPNILYWTGLDLEYSYLCIPQKKKPVFLVSALEYQRAKRYAKMSPKEYKNPLEQIKELLENNKRVGINTEYMTVAMMKKMTKTLKNKEYKPIEKICRALRIIKAKEEIAAIKKAAQIGDKIFSAVIKQFKDKRFKTECDVADFIDREAKKYNTTPSFETIVASGKNAALPHYHPQKIKLQEGFCVFDFGVRYNNYVSDMSRTIYFGNPSKKEKELYQNVIEANTNAIAALKIGKRCKTIDAISRKKFQYPHSLGHGIGVEVHEAPSLSPKSSDRIRENMCFTIEPGLYVPKKLGIRIEDDIWMAKEGPVVLTKSTKRLLCFP